MITLSPSILSANFGRFGEAAVQLVEAGATMLHFDIMDGHFVPNLTFGPQLVRDTRPLTEAFYDVHAMVEKPESYVEEFATAGASMLTIHPEATYHLDRLIHQIHDSGMKSGVALNPGTPVSQCEWVLPIVDRVLIMTVNPGFGGQAFIANMVEKIEQLEAIRQSGRMHFEIAVDGGISPKTAPAVVRAGARVLIAGSAIFKHPGGLQTALEELRRTAEDAEPVVN
jgi:ribulose-phosphate 3-epimerase